MQSDVGCFDFSRNLKLLLSLLFFMSIVLFFFLFPCPFHFNFRYYHCHCHCHYHYKYHYNSQWRYNYHYYLFSYKLYPQPCLHECAQAQHSPASHNCKLAARRRREEQVQLPCQHAQATTPPNEWPNKILSASTFVMAAHGTVQVLVYIMYENY